ncbi:hypothetical protein PSTG_03197 [Puccinia striiformis f. sp. tritici PST-78]|uniref:Uncharacterized protein n=1 Tax=Puccinia striiformis f. sp. tritici PST-78 TaxID=1165861 RepID=A0A0L0VWV1_9BASI|nr:hypothetical protein PSTG_03197 [Puccinia striiformis f. sp. tritici PST-78]
MRRMCSGRTSKGAPLHVIIEFQGKTSMNPRPREKIETAGKLERGKDSRPVLSPATAKAITIVVHLREQQIGDKMKRPILCRNLFTHVIQGQAHEVMLISSSVHNLARQGKCS